ncbi:MAG: M56 family metallopeptidase, partial [Defluviitaleaceae bacterium]|nr:M56 family metallopeptidase [Defluviitaleaceae bacterium]
MPLFETLLPMSFTGGVMIMVVFAARPLLKRLRTYNVLLLLWMCALFLLVAPFRPASPSSVYNAVGESPALSQAFTVGMAGTAPQFYAGGQGSLSVAPSRYLNIIPTIWLVGFFIILAYLCVSMAALKRLFKDAIPRTDLSARVPVYVSSRAAGPITYGIIRPRVVLPINIDETDAATLGHVLSHEYQHVRYKDALINIAWLVALCAHWFNPLAWAGWFFLRRDMETRCDAGAIKRLGANYIKSYANALLEMAPVRKAHALPLAFGSSSLNERIERVVAYRPAKRSAVIVATAMML